MKAKKIFLFVVAFVLCISFNCYAVHAGKKRQPVKELTITRYDSHALRLEWKARKRAKCYKIYRCRKKNGSYKLIKTTKKTHYINKGLKKNTKYYYRIKTCYKRKDSEWDSELCRAVAKKTKEYHRTTVFAGDSIMTGLSIYKSVDRINIGGSKKVVAYKGLGTLTFQTKSVFKGKTGVDKVISYKPYRIYIMLGMNEVHYRRKTDMIKNYEEVIEQLKDACPSTDIVLLSVSPVSKKTATQKIGFKQIPAFNKMVKGLAEKYHCRYYDFTASFKDKDGYLKGGSTDGVHWSVSGYNRFAKLLEKYDKSIDY